MTRSGCVADLYANANHLTPVFKTMRPLKVLTAALSFILLTLACGCATTRFPEPNLTPDNALSTLTAPRPGPDTMRIVAKIDYVDESQNKRVVGRDFVISAKAPQSMRMTLSSFDKALSTLVTDGHSFSLIDATQNIFVAGRATAQNLSQILPLYLSASDIYRILIGDFPTDDLAQDAFARQSFAWNAKVGAYQRSLPQASGNTLNIFYHYPHGDIVMITITQDNDVIYQYEAKDFKTFDLSGSADASEMSSASLRLPQTIIFRMKPQKTDVRLRIERRDINCDLSPAVFNLFPPEGVSVIIMPED
ncbi:MAG: hypothetical protein FWC40_07440 [Proteobacteria bacterium]|nr:hypothetical protein [Pseudomonadota bacterium]